jgi:hypothetical protein
MEPASRLSQHGERDPGVDEDRLEDSLVESRQNHGQHHCLRTPSHRGGALVTPLAATSRSIRDFLAAANHYTASSLNLQPTIDASAHTQARRAKLEGGWRSQAPPQDGSPR